MIIIINLKKIKILEIGCGTGIFGRRLIESLNKIGLKCEVMGVDISENSLHDFKKIAIKLNIFKDIDEIYIGDF